VQTSFSSKVLAWYDRHARRLPWRGHPDPYVVWVSEIMLQQTRVETVIPFFHQWVKRFPTLQDLAAASEQSVLSQWEGLGYYRRARSLHQAARQLVELGDGELPHTLKELRSLPGIGRYTAAAIASISFGVDAAALDGNVRRLLARAFNLEAPVDTSAGEKALNALAEHNLPPGQAGDYNQAMMDLGALVCLPRNPGCSRCPVGDLCQARALGVQAQRPVMSPRKPVPHHTVTAAVIQQGRRFLLAQRPRAGLLGGMWEFPGGKVEVGENLQQGLGREIREELGVVVRIGRPCGVYQHAYTHYRITLHAFRCTLAGRGTPRPLQAAALAWALPDDLQNYPMGKVDRQIARTLVEEIQSSHAGR
jgi:A/G-specific adenine glycosylase